MVFKSKVSSPPKEPKQPAFNPVPPDEHKAEAPRHVPVAVLQLILLSQNLSRLAHRQPLACHRTPSFEGAGSPVCPAPRDSPSKSLRGDTTDHDHRSG